MNYVALFFGGAFLCNCIPHLTAGLQGMPFPTPFAKPRGVGKSPPFVNFIWGTFNVWVGLYLLSNQPLVVGPNPGCLALAAGALAIGAYLSLHFSEVQRELQQGRIDADFRCGGPEEHRVAPDDGRQHKSGSEQDGGRSDRT